MLYLQIIVGLVLAAILARNARNRLLGGLIGALTATAVVFLPAIVAVVFGPFGESAYSDDDDLTTLILFAVFSIPILAGGGIIGAAAARPTRSH
jgi:hypothetical protein